MYQKILVPPEKSFCDHLGGAFLPPRVLTPYDSDFYKLLDLAENFHSE